MSTLDLKRKQEILEGVPLFANLPEEDVASIAEVATTRALRPREALFGKDDPSAQIFVVVSGRLKVVTTSDDGDDLMFCVVGAGEVLGEVGVLAGRLRTATVLAMEKCELLVIDSREFQPLLRKRPDIAVELLIVLAERLARLSEFLEDTHFLNLPVRLAKKLIDFANEHGVVQDGPEGAEEVLIDLRLSQEEWGDLVGTTRESINKQFRAWGKEGLIRVEKGRVVIVEAEGIQDLANCVVF